MLRVLTGTLMVAVALGCAQTPRTQAPFDARVVTPAANERIQVDDVLFLFDSSGSMEQFFPSEKALYESFAAGMPNGSYSTGSIAFGGFERQEVPLQRFERNRVRADAARVSFLNEATPLHQVLGEARDKLAGRSGRAAVVLFSDGIPTDYAGSDADPELSLAAARELVKAHKGTVCLHAVQIGSAEQGAQFLRKLSGVSSCGSTRLAMAISDPGALHNFQRQIFLAQRDLPPVAAAPSDADRDGVIDANDRCPNTPIGAQVDARGCWSLRGLNFAFDSAAIEGQYDPQLNTVAELLKLNPGIRVRIDGHTDNIGPDTYNQQLSEKRASAVRSYLVGAGIPADRLETRGFGEASPAVPNDSRPNRARNRRAELTPVQ